MFKINICRYYQKGVCRYMNKPELCKYTHGEKDRIFPLCRYGSECSTANCKLKHPVTKGIDGKKDNIRVIRKNKNVHIKNSVNPDIIEEEGIKCIRNDISKNDEIDKSLEYINEYYLNIIKKLKNKIHVYKKEITKYNSSIFNLKSEYNMLKTKNNNLIAIKNKNIEKVIYKSSSTNTECAQSINAFIQTNENIRKNTRIQTNIPKNGRNVLTNGMTAFTQTENMEHKNGIAHDVENVKFNIPLSVVYNTKNDRNVHINLDLNKKLIKYKKWINIYNLFKKYNFNYKSINLDELKQYVKDKNIHKVKERCVKVYNYYNKILKKEVKDYLYVTEIFKIKI